MIILVEPGNDSDDDRGFCVWRLMIDFYATMAQVLPLLLLALIWDSAFLDRLRQQRRLSRRVDPAGVWFWTKPRVRIYTLIIATVVIASTGTSILVLAQFIPDSIGLRIALSCGLALVLGTLLTRIYYDVIVATSTGAERAIMPTSPNGGAGVNEPGQPRMEP
jgi:hypothetical protein